MTLPYEDKIIDEKNRVQEQILKEAKGNFKEYSKIVHKEAEKLRKKLKVDFKPHLTVAKK